MCIIAQSAGLRDDLGPVFLRGGDLIKIAGIDLSTSNTGFAILTDNMLTYSSVISCPDDLLLKKPVKHKNDNKAEFKKYRSSVSAENLNRRTLYLSDAIPKQIKIWKPDIVVCEDIYYGKDISEMKACARLQGALMYCCNCLGFEILFTEPSAWRSALGIPLMDKDKKRFHREDFKRIAVNMVEELFGIHVSDDEAEAILLPLAYPYLKIL